MLLLLTDSERKKEGNAGLRPSTVVQPLKSPKHWLTKNIMATKRILVPPLPEIRTLSWSYVNLGNQTYDPYNPLQPLSGIAKSKP